VLTGRRDIVSRKSPFVVAIFVLLYIFGHLTGSMAATIVKTVDFPRPTISYTEQGITIKLDGAPAMANPGEPLLPVYGLEILLAKAKRWCASASGP
jgi:hypothetical protein